MTGICEDPHILLAMCRQIQTPWEHLAIWRPLGRHIVRAIYHRPRILVVKCTTSD